MRERAATIDSGEFESEGGVRALMRRALGRSPRDAIAIFVLVLASGAILANALYRQPGPHPAPIFSIKPRPVAAEPADGVVPALPRARPQSAVATNQSAAPAVVSPSATRQEPTVRTDARAPAKSEAAVPRRADPIADIIAPAQRVTAVQRALNDYGYGPVKATGIYGAETITAIQRFERDRKLPITGQISPRVVKELGVLTGKPLE